MKNQKLQPFFQSEEKFYCPKCEITPNMHIYACNFKCVNCNTNLQFKITIKEYIHSCCRVNPVELKIGELVTLENENIHQILNIYETNEGFSIALKSYTLIHVTSDSILTRIEGGWYPPAGALL